VANGRSGAGAISAVMLMVMAAAIAMAGSAIAQSTYIKTNSAVGMTPITGGTVVFASNAALGGLQGDDSASVVTLPFSFKFYGTTYTSTSVNTNGLLVFGTASRTDYSNAAIPSTALPNGYIALFWEDCQVYSSTSTPPVGFLGGPAYRTIVSHTTSGTTPNRIWTMEYLYLTDLGTNRSELSGQIRLHENGSIELLYLAGQTWIGTEVNATIGIENPTGTAGIDATGLGINNTQPPTSNYRFDPVHNLGYFNNFESTSGIQDGWSVTALAGYSSWEWGTPAASGGPTTGANGSVNAWSVNRTGLYANYTDTKLTSPRVALTGAVTPFLTFQMNIAAESGYDGGRLMLSRNGGPFTMVSRTDPGYITGAPNQATVAGFPTSGGGWSSTVPSATGYQEVKLNLFALTTAGLSGMTTTDVVQAQFWFLADDIFNDRGWIVDDFKVDNPPQDDLGVTAAPAPVSGLTNRSALDVTITIQNFGGTAQSSFPVSYQVTAGPNGAGSVVTETYTGATIQPATSGTYTFTTKLNASSVGTYTIVASTALATDGNSSNNSFSKSFTTQGQVTAPYFTSFETTDGSNDGWTRAGNHSTLWQWGTLTAFSGAPSTGANGTTKAWSTGLNANYNINSAQAYLDTPYLVLNGMNAPRVSFFHSMNSESGWDCGVFQISRNGGAFVSVSNTDAGWVENGPNAASISGLSQPCWHGIIPSPAGTYHRSSLNLYSLTTAGLTGISATDVLTVRFWFSSDTSGATWPGWTVDDFSFFDVNPALDVQLTAGQFASEAPAPIADLILGGFTLTAAVTQNIISSATIQVTGTIAASDISNFKLWFDADANGSIGGSDVLLAGPVSATAGNVTFSGSPLALLTAGQIGRVLVTANVASTAGGKTVGLSVASSGSIVCNPALVTGTFPVSTPLKTLVTPLSYPYLNDFESGSGVSQGWATSGTHATLWQHGTPVPFVGTNGTGPSSARSGSNVWGTNLIGNYDITSAQALLTSPLLSLSGATDPELSFWMHLDTESAWDGFSLQLSRNGGTWITLLQNDPGFTSTGPNDSDVDGVANLAHGWSGQIPSSGTGYQKVRLKLASITTAGLTGIATTEAIRVRWWFGADTSGSNWPGLYLDDVRLGEAGKAPITTVRISGELVAHNGSITVPFGSSIASRNITITAVDPDGSPITVSTTVSNTNTHNGIVAAEFSGTSTGSSISLSPSSGSFNFGSGSHAIAVSANDGEDTTLHTVTVNVTDALAATLTAGNVSGRLGSTVVVPVSISWAGTQAVGGVSATLAYDTSALTYVSGALATGQAAGFTTSANAAAGVVTINITNPAATLTLVQGDVVNLTFTVNGLAALSTTPLTLANFATLYPGGGALHTGTKNNANMMNGSFTAFATPPVLNVTRGGFPVPSGSTFTVAYNSTVSALGLNLSASDEVGESVSISTTMPANAATAGLVAAQFNTTAAGNPASLSPTTGTFSTPNASYAFSVSASDGFTTTTRTFTIQVGANTNPTIVVTSNNASLGNGTTAQVGINSTMAALGLAITVTDADGDAVSLAGTVSNVTTQGILVSQFNAASGPSPLVANPAAGTFSVPGVAHVVSLTATDAANGTANYTFTLQTRSNAAPVITVFSTSGQVANNSTVNVPFKATLAFLNLQISVSDADGDQASLNASLSNVTTQGILTSEFSKATGNTPFTVAPTTGSFIRGGVNHVLTLTAADPYQQTTYSVTLAVAANANPTVVVKSHGETIGEGQTITVPYNTSVASLGLTVDVADAEGDPTSLVTTISNTVAAQEIVLAEFNRIASAVPYTRSPIAGRFSASGASHVFSLLADDGFGGTATRTFTVVAGQNTAPQFTFTAMGEPAGLNPSYGFTPGQQIAPLGLGLLAEDADVSDTLTITASITGQTVEGIQTSDFVATSVGSPVTRLLNSGVMSVDGAVIAIRVTVTDKGGLFTTGTLTLTSASNVRIVTASLPDMTAGTAYSAQLMAVGGTSPYVWGGFLPEYLSINPTTGIITGTPPRILLTGSESLSITIQDAQNRTANATLSVAIKAAPSLTTELLPAELLPITNPGPNLLNSITNINPNGNIIKHAIANPFFWFGSQFDEMYISTNGFITFTEPTGPLSTNTNLISPLFPPFSIALFWDKLSFNSNSNISISNFISNTSTDGPVSNDASDLLVVTFSNMQVAGQPNSSLTGQIAINPTTGDVSLNYANSGQNWTGATATAGIKGPSADFVIDPFNAGAFLGAPPANNVAFSAPPEVTLSTAVLATATGLVPYTFNMAAIGGTSPYVWSMDGGPTWLSLNPTSGILSGTPPISTGGATETITFTVLDSANSTATKTLVLTINAGVAPVLPPAPDSGSQCSMVAGSHSGGIGIILGLLALVASGLWIRRRTVA